MTQIKSYCIKKQIKIKIAIVHLTIAMEPQGVREFEEDYKMFRISEV